MKKIPIIQLLLNEDSVLEFDVNPAIYEKREDFVEAIQALRDWCRINEDNMDEVIQTYKNSKK
jgi:hypothetical protein